MDDSTRSQSIRYGRSQKFRLSEKGVEAVTAYEVTIEQARGTNGRAEFDAARAAWGAPRGLVPDDAQFLVEFGAKGRTIKEASDAMRDCGTTPQEVKDATTRLIGFGMLEAMPAAMR